MGHTLAHNTSTFWECSLAISSGWTCVYFVVTKVVTDVTTVTTLEIECVGCQKTMLSVVVHIILMWHIQELIPTRCWVVSMHCAKCGC